MQVMFRSAVVPIRDKFLDANGGCAETGLLEPKKPETFPSPAFEMDLSIAVQPSKNSFIRAKNPVDSGLFSLEESCSNSWSSSRWRLVSFCGVSIWIWM